MHIANHYVRINSRVFVKGERIPEDLPAEKIRWLLEKGAVHEAAPPLQEESEPETADMIPADPEDAEEQLQSAQEAAEEACEDAEETYEDTEAPEVDVMAGIVQGAEDEAPKKTTRARDAAKKQIGRRKGG